MRSSARVSERLTAFLPKVLPLLALLLLWTLLAFTGLYWGGAKIYESSWLFYVSSALWLVLGAHAVLAWFQGRRMGDWVDLSVFAFLVYAAAWYHFTPIEFLARMEGLWVLTYAAVFLSVRYVFPQRGWLVALLAGFLVVALVCCGFALSKFGQAVYPIWGEERPDYGVRISGFFGCPNHFGNYMVMGALVAVVLAGIQSFPWVLRICLFYISGVLTFGVFLSLSRGSYAAWLTGMLVVAAVFFFRSMWGWIWKLGVGAAVAAAIAGGFVFNEAAVSRGSNMLHDDFRFELFPEAWRIWLMKPVFGHGPGTFDYVHLQNQGPTFQSRAYFPHNDYLNTLCDYGAVGLVLVLLFVVLLVLAFRPPRESTRTERQEELALLGWAATAAMLVHSMVDFNFHIPACGIAFFSIVAVASSRTDRQQRAPLCLPLNFPIAGMALAAVFVLVSQTWKLREAKRVFPFSDDGLVELAPERLMLLVAAARQWDPSSPTITVRAADALRVRVARVEMEINRLRRSATPSEAEAARMEELLKLRQEMGEDALELYKLGREANPMDDALQIKRGMVLDLLDRPQEAYLFYQQAMQKQPHNRFFVHVLGFHFLRAGNLARAKECFREALSISTGRRERNKETLEQARQALQMIERFEKQQDLPVPSGQPAPPPPAAVAPPPPVAIPEEEQEPVLPPKKNLGPDVPILGPARETP